MLLVEQLQVWGFEGAIRGARNPMNSWSKSDSTYVADPDGGEQRMVVGPNDLDLLRRLYRAGTEHRKYMRQIFISLDITAPFYWWKQFDTYKIGTTSNSCSTMHKLTSKEFERGDFSCEHLLDMEILDNLIGHLNHYREIYLDMDKAKAEGLIGQDVSKKDVWWQMIQLLPESYNQKRTITMNYENAVLMIRQRSGHKLDEWHQLIDQFYTLPCLKEIMEVEK